MDYDSALQKFGLQSFRPGQRQVIEEILAGHDCLCVMPTGGGKSLCFQLPTVLRNGLTIVVSPLIALMKDQVDSLCRRGIAATLINSTLSNAEQNQRLNEVAAGRYSLLYVAPERLRNSRFLDVIRATPVQLLAVDEAHCISEWGHDFRPDYARLGQFRSALGGVQTIALTATATPRVRQDIQEILRLRKPKQFITGFARSNLHFGSLYCHGDRDKEMATIEFLRRTTGSGIIYTATRKRCESLVELIAKEVKISVGAYHAGLTLDQRKFIQEQFMQGKLKTIVATNAFGMGIDKADLRYVLHYNIPGSIEAYYQEAGRAGRDGLPSQCVILYSPKDRYIQEFFIENANPPRDLIAKVYEHLCALTEDPIEFTSEEIREQLNVPQSAEAVGSALQILSRTGVIERLEVSGGLAMLRINSQLPTLVDLLPRDAEVKRRILRAVERAIGDRRDEAVYVHPRWLMQETGLAREALSRHLNELRKLANFEYVPPFRGRAIHFRKRNVPFEKLEIDFQTLEARKQADFEKLDRVVDLAQSKRCRQLAILSYFGDPSAEACGRCDRCQGTAGWPKIEQARNTTNTTANTLSGKRQGPQRKDNPTVSLKPPALTFSSNDQVACQELLFQILKAIERNRGMFGKLLIVDFLTGGKTEKVQRLRLYKIEGYGLLRAAKKKSVGDLLDLLQQYDFLETRMPVAQRPTISVTTSAKNFLATQSMPPEPILKKLYELQSLANTTKLGSRP